MKNKPEAPTPAPEPKDRSIQILIGIAIVWASIFVLTLETHSRITTRLLPIVGVIFIGYLIYCTYKLLRRRGQ